MRRLARVAMLVAGLLLAGSAVSAAEPVLEVAVLDADRALSLEQLFAAEPAAAFSVIDDGRVELGAAAEQRRWLRLRAELPPVAGGWMLEFERAAIERVDLYLPLGGRVERQARDGFFQPADGETPLRSHFAFALGERPGGPFEAYLAVDSRAAAQIVPRLRAAPAHRSEAAALGQRASAWYGALLVAALTGLMLFAALRQRGFLHAGLFCAAGLLWLAAEAGHLYQLPLAPALGWMGSHGVWLLGHLLAAALIAHGQQLIDPATWSPLARILRWACRLHLALAALCLLHLLPAFIQQPLSLLMIGLGLPALALLCLRHGRTGLGPLLPLALLWLALGWAVLLRGAVAYGLLAPGSWSTHGYLPLLALGLLLLFAQQTARVSEFRRRHEQVHRLHEQAGADLQLEQRRRQFNDALREATLRNSGAPGDLEWRAFKQLTQSIAALLPHRAVALTATGFRGFDFLLAEPLPAKARYCSLLASRGATLKGIARSRSAVQLKLDLSPALPGSIAEFAQIAVVPLQIARPGWGALLIERDGEASFEPHELALAAEFVALTLAAADEGAERAQLRRTADVDPLTGVLNRGAGELRLEQCFRRSLSDKRPLAVLYLDLDHFKQINERHGDAIGDECLRALVDAVRPQLGADDLLIRYAGESFVAVLPGRDGEQACELAERVRAQVALVRIDGGEAPIKLTVSIGVSPRQPADERAQQAIDRAARALQTAKRGGRNRVELASPYGSGEVGGYPPVY
jgi:diguanylate cyclase (GGDEF)-like protein